METKDNCNRYQVHDITENDLEEIILIAEECNLGYWSLEDYKSETKRADSIHLLIKDSKDSKKPAGFLIARLTIPHEAEIYNIAIRKTSQRNGLGKLLLNGAIAKAVELENTRIVWLEVRESNQSAISFYRNNGFSVAGLRKNFYSNPSENAILMKLERVSEEEKCDNNQAKET